MVNTIVKKVTVGVPIKGVTSGAFAITNLGGVILTQDGGVGQGDILVYNASQSAFLADSDTYIKTTDSAEIKSMFSAGGDLSYDSAAGQFSINVDSFAAAISAVSYGDGSASAPSITNTGDTNTGLHFPAADTLAFTAGGTSQFTMTDGVIAPVTDNDVDLGTSSLEFKDAYFDGTVHTDAINLDGTAITSTAAEINLLDTAVANTVVNSKAVIYGSGGQLAGTLSTAAQANVTSLGTLTALTVDNVIINGATIGHTSDTDLITVADGVVAVAGEVTGTGFTGTLDGILGSGTAAAATVTTLNSSGAVNLNLVTDSTSSTSGALIVDGGVGIAKKLFVGTALDVSTTLTVDGASTLTGAVLKGATATEHGAGAVATSFAPVTRRSTTNGVIITKIHFDLTGLGGKGGTANDVIGLPAGGNAFIGKNVVGTNGVIYRAELACIELAAAASGSATVDIDVATNTSGTIAYDGAGGTAKLFNTGGMVAGQELSNITPAITADDFFYLVEGDTAATDGVYNGGQFVLTLYGHAVA